MHWRLSVGLGICALAASAAPARAQTGEPTRFDLDPAAGHAIGLFPQTGGRALLVTRSPLEVSVHLVADGHARTVRRAAWGGVYGDAEGDASGVELLVRERGRLRLVRVGADGRRTTRWSVRAGRRAQAGWARGPGERVAIAWRDGRTGVRLVTAQGRRFTRARRVRGLWPARREVLLQDVAIDASGRTVLAVSDYRTYRVATVAASGRLLHLRRSGPATTLQSLATSDDGRVALLADETGAAALSDQECVRGETPRRVRAAVRAPGVSKLGSPALLDEHEWECAQAGARLVAGAGDRFAIVWGPAMLLREPPRPPEVRASVAGPATVFGPARTLWTGAEALGAALLGDGSLLVLAARPDPERPGSSALAVGRADAAGTVGPLHDLAPAWDDAILAVGPDGTAAAAWRSGPGRWAIAFGP